MEYDGRKKARLRTIEPIFGDWRQFGNRRAPLLIALEVQTD